MAKRKRKRPHGTGSYCERDGRHVIQWTDADHKRHTMTLPTEPEARAALAQACAGLKVNTKKAGNTLESLAQTWMDGRAEMPSNYDDRNRWKNHLGPVVGGLQPDEVDVPALKALIVSLRGKGLSKGTVRLCVALLSSLYSELVEDGVATVNPARLLSRKTRRELISDRDWKKTPFLRTTSNITQIHNLLVTRNEPVVALAYVVGALAGLRTSEVRALRWSHIDLGTRLIHVQEQVKRRSQGVKELKDKESRFVPISDSLYWYLRTAMPINARDQLVVQSPTGTYFSAHRMGKAFSDAFTFMERGSMRWYEATRHTFASQWVINGGSLETLREMMGHSSVTVTERYAHLVPGQYTDADRARVQVDLVPGTVALSN